MQLQTASGFGSILSKKPFQPSEMCPEKIFTPDSLRLLVNPLRKTTQATRCNTPKKYSSGLPSAFGQFPAKSPVSVRRCAPKKRSHQTASGFWSILCKNLRQPSEMYPGKMFTPVRFRLLVNPLRKTTQVTRCDSSKKSSSRQPWAFGQSPAKSPVSLRKCTPAIRLGLSALGCNKDKRNGV